MDDESGILELEDRVSSTQRLLETAAAHPARRCFEAGAMANGW